jgi:hypothetical protein
MARTPRTFSRRGHAEAKAGENIGQGKSREDVTEEAMQTNQREAVSEFSLTRSPGRHVGVLRLPRLRNTRFHGGRLRDGRTWRERVLSLKHRRCKETNQYHPTQQSPGSKILLMLDCPVERVGHSPFRPGSQACAVP